MFVKNTKIIVPYTLPDSTDQRGMHILCEYYDKPDNVLVDKETVYSFEINPTTPKEQEIHDDINFFNEPINYIGYCDKFVLKQDPLKYNIINLQGSEDENYEVDPDIIGENPEEPTRYIRMYMPMETISTYYRGRTNYLVSIYIYVDNTRVYLYNSVINTFKDSKACVPFVRDYIHYQEYIDIPILDPNRVEALYDSHNDEYLINISIHSVVLENGSYYITEDTFGGSSFISFTEDEGIRVKSSIHPETMSFNINFDFSKRYIQCQSLDTYISNIYYSNTTTPEFTKVLHYYLINKYDEEVYMDKPIVLTGGSTAYELPFTDVLGDVISTWGNWMEGLMLTVYFEIYDGSVTAEDIVNDDWGDGRIVTFEGNSISITPNIFKYIIPGESGLINLEEIEMNNSENISVYNKVINNTITVNQSNVGAGVIKPLFYRAYEVQSITLHRDMKENICINLDEYKNKCDKFYLKLCGNYFPEYARNYDGVIFNVNGSIITSSTGSYYICDTDKNFISSGKYKCE